MDTMSLLRSSNSNTIYLSGHMDVKSLLRSSNSNQLQSIHLVIGALRLGHLYEVRTLIKLFMNELCFATKTTMPLKA